MKDRTWCFKLDSPPGIRSFSSTRHGSCVGTNHPTHLPTIHRQYCYLFHVRCYQADNVKIKILSLTQSTSCTPRLLFCVSASHVKEKLFTSDLFHHVLTERLDLFPAVKQIRERLGTSWWDKVTLVLFDAKARLAAVSFRACSVLSLAQDADGGSLSWGIFS